MRAIFAIFGKTCLRFHYLNEFNSNSVFELITVMVSLFASESESKDFCQTFKDNDNGIDYTLLYVYNQQKVDKSELLLVIGQDYWRVIYQIEGEEPSLQFYSNESRSHNVLGTGYSGAFVNRPKENRLSMVYGFVTVRESRISKIL